MTYQGTTREPEADGLLRRGLFARRDPSPAEPDLTPTEARLADTLSRTVDEHLDDGVRTLEQQAVALLREVATEVWRASSKDVRPEQERIMTLLARDQAIRSLLTSSDERFQSLAVRAARMEDYLRDISESERRTREAMEASATAVHDIAQSPTLHSVQAVRSQLEMVERHIAEAFAHMDARDENLSETILSQVQEHGELITHETTRIVQAMQTYVQGGAEAMGRLAQQIEKQAESFAQQDNTTRTSVREVVREQTGGLVEQQKQFRASVEKTIDARVRGLADLIRSDSHVLKQLIEDRTAGANPAGDSSIDADPLGGAGEQLAEWETEFERRLMDALDERMTAVARLVRADTQAIADRLHRLTETRAAEAAGHQSDQELLRQLLRAVKEMQAGMASDVQSTVDSRLQSLVDNLHREGQSQAETLLKVAEMLSGKIDRLTIRVDEGVGSDMQIVVDRMSDAIRAMSTVQRRESA
jgi:hypothetical protein